MAIVHSPLLSLSARGALTRLLSFSRVRGQNRVRGQQKRLAAWTNVQQAERSRIGQVSQAYKMLSDTDLQGYARWNGLRARLHSPYVLFLRSCLMDMHEPPNNQFFTFYSISKSQTYTILLTYTYHIQTQIQLKSAPNYVGKIWDQNLNLLGTSGVYYHGAPDGTMKCLFYNLQDAETYYVQIQRLSTGQPASGLF